MKRVFVSAFAALLISASPAWAVTSTAIWVGNGQVSATNPLPVTGSLTGGGAVTIASGGVASGAFASGALSSGSVADGAIVTLGAKADAKSTATDTTPVTAMQVLKQISASVQTPPSQAVTNTGTFATQSTLSAETTKVIGTVNIAAGQTITTTNAGTFAVQAAQSGTWTVQPGNTANTTPWLVTPYPIGGTALSNYSANVTSAGSGAGTGGVAVGSSGVRHLYGYQIYNGNASVCYIQFLDQTQALTNLGTTVPVKSIGIPANGGANLISSIPIITTATALTIGVTTTRSGSTACSTGLDINLDYN